MTRSEFAEEVKRTREGVRRFLAALCCGDLALADDIAQESYMKAYLAADSFRHDASFETWIRRIACREFLSQRRSQRSTSEIDEASQTMSPDESDCAFRYQALYAALARISERERTAIALYYLEGYSTSEVSDIIGVNEQNVRQILSRGRVRLRFLMNNNQ